MAQDMNDLNFDIYAMIKPKTDADISAMLDEALAELKNFNRLWDELFDELDAQK